MSRFHHLHCFVALAAFALAPSISSAQFNQAPLISTSLGGIVSATYGYFTYISATNGLSSGSSDRIISTTTSIVAQTSGAISITTNNVNTGYFNSNGVLTVPGISATANLTSVTSLYASGDITLGTRLKFINPNGNGGGSAVIGFMGDGTRRLDVYDYGSGGTLMSLTDSLSGGRLGIGTVAPNASSQLEISSTTRGFLPPRLTPAQRDAIAVPVAGLMIYNTFANRPEYYNGTMWVTFTGIDAILDGTTLAKASTSCLKLLNEGFSTGDGLYYIAPNGGTGYQAYCDMTTDGGGWTLAKAALPAVSDANWFNAAGFTTTKSATLNSNAYAISDADIRTLTKTVYRVEGTCNNWSARTVGYADGRCDYSSPSTTPNTYCRQWYSNVGLSTTMGTLENYGYYNSYWGITDVHSGYSGSYISTQVANKFQLGYSGSAGFCGGTAANSSLRIWVR